MPTYDDLRYIRFDILLRIDAADSSKELLSIQEAIADAIISAEAGGPQFPNDDKKNHIEKLRLYADGLVWREIHPHTIRQLAKNVATPKSILSQGSSFDAVRRSARRYVDLLGFPVFIADITNVIRVGDVIVVTDIEKPLIVEVKSHLPRPEHLMQGRRGRQISRSLAIQRYLQTGKAKLFGDDIYMTEMETPYRALRNWNAITYICQEALRKGFSRIELSEHETIWAYSSNEFESVLEDVRLHHNEESASIFGTSAGLMNMVDGNFAPPSAWPIPAGLQFALVEEDIVLAHLLDTAAFDGATSGGKSMDIRLGQDFPVVVKSAEREYPLSLRFLYDVVYGYETTESAIAGIFNFTETIENTIQFDEENQPVFDFGPPADGKPTLHDVSSVEKAFSVAAASDISGEEFVALATDVANQLTLNPLRVGEGFKIDDEEVPRYGVTSVATLRKLVAAGSWT